MRTLRIPLMALGILFLTLTLLFSTAIANDVTLPAGCSETGSYYQNYSQINKYEPRHTGVDFGCKSGTPVSAPADGKVYAIFGNWFGFGKDLWIQVGKHYFMFAHLSEFEVSVGQDVHTGQIVAKTGQTGWDAAGNPTTTGPTLHWGCADKPPEKFGYFYEHKSETGSGWMDPFTCLSGESVSGSILPNPNGQSDPNVGGGQGPAKDGSGPISLSKPGDITWDALPDTWPLSGRIFEVLNITLAVGKTTPVDILRQLPVGWYIIFILIGAMLYLLEKRWRPMWGVLCLLAVVSILLITLYPRGTVFAAMSDSDIGRVPQQVLDSTVEKGLLFPAPPDSKSTEEPVGGGSHVDSEVCAVSLKYPQSILQWCGLITRSAKDQGVDANLIAAVMLQESGGNSNAYSASGAVGLLQVMPRDGLAASFMCTGGPCFKNRPTTDQLYDPDYNVQYGTKMLSGLIAKFGNTRDALKHYGPSGVGYYYADLVLAIWNKDK